MSETAPKGLSDGQAMTHRELVERAERWLRGTMRCGVVLTERGAGSEVPDAIGWGKGVIVVECKVSRADFFADRRKPHRAYGMGRKRFYLTPPDLVGAHEVPDGWGLAVVTPCRVRILRDAPVHAETRFIAGELRLVLSELYRYQLHGITYPPLVLNERSEKPAAETAKRPEHVCGLQGYCPGAPYFDPICPACVEMRERWLREESAVTARPATGAPETK